MKDSPTAPMNRNIVPMTKSHFRRFVQVMRKPVAVPMADATSEGTMSRRPDVVALSRSTAWK